MLVILPCAGGSASNYNKYKDFSNSIILYEYPGHWSRYEEPLETSVEQIAQTLLPIIKGRKDKEITLFGHSMGGLIAWKLAHKLIDEEIFVKRVYIAACCSPEIKPEFIENIQNDADIKVLLQNIRQVPDRILNSTFFNEDLLPVIRNDFNLVKEYIKEFQGDEFKALSVPITCLCGASDPVIDVEEMKKWEKYTSEEFNCYSYPGDHFFVYDKCNVERIMTQIL